MNTNTLLAADPAINATVLAAAGTGKTWLLTTRIVRLLLVGAKPSSILAITFGRKAAAEMRERVWSALANLHNQTISEREQQLLQMGVAASAANLAKAANLYQQLLQNPQRLRIQTFHSFCIDLLQNFAQEAGVPAGFELLEQSGDYVQQAWQRLMQQAASDANSPLAQAVEHLFASCGSLPIVAKLARGFIDKRSDFWAYTDANSDALEFACADIGRQLQLAAAPFAELEQLAAVLAALVAACQGAKAGKRIDDVIAQLGTLRLKLQSADFSAALSDSSCIDCYQSAMAIFFTQAGSARALTPNKSCSNAVEIVALLEQVQTIVEAVGENLRRERCMALNRAWLQVGVALGAEFSKLKTNNRLLDFVDVEWYCYKLLTSGDNVDWVQYQLDQRIDHLLFDEFQDTNPTQWQLVLPLLQELAAAESERSRSVFLVGDVKQSIYGFRRANPELQLYASQWLSSNLQAQNFVQNSSRRSSPAIIDVVNAVFCATGTATTRAYLQDFSAHQTFRQDMWGEVCVLAPEFAQAVPPVQYAAQQLRDPLSEPPPQEQASAIEQEARRVARYIQELLQNPPLIDTGSTTRHLQADDILVLLRAMTKVGEFERAFKELQLPYQLSHGSDFFNSAEVVDLQALLRILDAPFDDYQLAVVLRSPIFNASHQDLLAVARAANSAASWWQALQQLASSSAILARAASLLARWQQLAQQLPVHDLLQQIYSEAQLVARYRGYAVAAHQQQAVANLYEFMQLALEIDSGRYPSIGSFLQQLRKLAADDYKSKQQVATAAIQIMTVHQSKGLEAAVVFLVDSNRDSAPAASWQPLVRWPAASARPTNFMLYSSKDECTSLQAELLAQQQQDDEREANNLLYVAMTRARHKLVVTASASSAAKLSADSNYSKIRAGLIKLNNLDATSELGDLCYRYQGTASKAVEVAPIATAAPPLDFASYSAKLWQDFVAPAAISVKSPSQAQTALAISGGNLPQNNEIFADFAQKMPENPDLAANIGKNSQKAAQIGIYIHKLLEAPQRQIRAWQLTPAERQYCQSCVDAVLTAANLRFLFADAERAYCEQPLIYRDAAGEMVSGVIDRLVFAGDTIYIVDYKSRQLSHDCDLAAIALQYQPQLALYAAGIAKIYPDKTIKCGVLFTALAHWQAVEC